MEEGSEIGGKLMNSKAIGILLVITLMLTTITTTAFHNQTKNISTVNVIDEFPTSTIYITDDLMNKGIEIYQQSLNNTPPNTPDQLIGPSTGYLYQTLRYYTMISDPDGDPMRIGIDYFNDGTVDEWSIEYYPSGATLYIDITFTFVATHHITVKAKDINDAESGWSIPKTVVITEGSTNPPNNPTTPMGPISGIIGKEYSYSTASIDGDDDQIQYGFDWDGDDEVDEWSAFFDSGDICTLSHSWDNAGIYGIKVKARDENEFTSDWSETLNVTITDSNSQPLKPEIPMGPVLGQTGKSYTFSSSAVDPDGDLLYYKWHWGDEESDWEGPFQSGDTISKSHIWANQGTFIVKVKAKDSNDAESVWSDPYSFTLPKNRVFINPFLRFLENHPNIFLVFQRIFEI